jgi:hypothetical protein
LAAISLIGPTTAISSRISSVVEEAGVQRYALCERGVDEFEVRVLPMGGGTVPDSIERHSGGKACVLICVEGSVEVRSAASHRSA